MGFGSPAGAGLGRPAAAGAPRPGLGDARLAGGRRAAAALPGGLLGDALLELLVALGRAAGPFAQALDLARLREVQQRQHREAGDRGEARVGADLLDLAL